MKVTCHQPNLLPALPFWAKVNAADTVILLDDVQYVRKSAKDHYANRCKLGDDAWYTIPVKDKFPQLISEVEIADGWEPRNLVDRLRNDYRNTPFFGDLFYCLVTCLFLNFDTKLAELNFGLVRWAMSELQIYKPIYIQSSLPVNELDRDLRLAKLVKAVGGDTYVAGIGGLKYMNPDAYKAEGVDVEICYYNPIEYDRGERPWVPYMSVVDALCYHGEKARDFLKARVEPWLAVRGKDKE